MTRARLLLDEPAAGGWNMACDEALLASVGESRVPVLRFYGWSEPTLSLGYFQAAGDRRLHSASAGCALVRRSSGGGAIVHDRELTYSCVVPVDDRWGRELPALASAFHETLVVEFADRGIGCRLVETADAERAGEFLCFRRRAAGDVVCGEQSDKIAGSAQRRHRTAVLQHGSILLAGSASAPELPGVRELSGKDVSAVELSRAWAPRLSLRLGWELSLDELTNGERSAAKYLEWGKFSHKTWTHRR